MFPNEVAILTAVRQNKELGLPGLTHVTDISGAYLRHICNSLSLRVLFKAGQLKRVYGYTEGQKGNYEEMVKDVQEIPGLTRVRSFVQESKPSESVINISDRYEVSGFSRKGNVNIGVVINGRILSVGNKLDGMTITNIGNF